MRGRVHKDFVYVAGQQCDTPSPNQQRDNPTPTPTPTPTLTPTLTQP